jgi:alanyl-tRNA synthetase
MELVRYEADTRGAAATLIGDLRVVTHIYADRHWEWVRNLAQLLCDHPQTVVMLALGGASPQWVFTRSQDVSVDMGALLRVAMKASGGRGGGRPDWAQGGGGDPTRIEEALAAAVEVLKRET